jgi:GNAT superfamily N-acetyltransferase
MIEIRKLDKLGLQHYVNSKEYEAASVVPISKHRAISHLHNPRIQENDTLLVLAYIDNVMIGYLGALPGNFYDDKNQHFAWMSCLWIDPNHRGKKIAQQLILACFDAWNGHLLLTEYTEAAGALYHKMAIFRTFHESEGRRWYILSNLSNILPSKRLIFEKIKPILSSFDNIVNAIIISTRTLNKMKRKSVQWTIEKTLTESAKTFIRNTNLQETFRRSPEDIDWILKFPWLISGSETEESRKYHFSAYANHFDCRSVEIKDETNITISVFIYTNRNGHLRIPYIYNESRWDIIVNVIKQLIVDFKIHTVTIYHAELLAYLEDHSLARSFNKAVKRSYLISSNLADTINMDHLLIQDGDGDCAFT